jgi:phosphoribosylanthranilate isomerase
MAMKLQSFVKTCNCLDFKIIKAFGINEDFDFSVLGEYSEVCDYFLFDTKVKRIWRHWTSF